MYLHLRDHSSRDILMKLTEWTVMEVKQLEFRKTLESCTAIQTSNVLNLNVCICG